ncbi:O-antigen ligase family protein [Terricaulis silvestris]|uniref:Lipid A core-O-antigen ligase n=1 Tax=Terricaulis silvestris TaxID=2686094 RepID=A0A6I6MLU6_9CAUL|nr:O-antigen ligase family protein [Terricaulis silvestris]QGZ96415.1 Lipid A core - O-antigen ligase [Terricaulis silvestris]
MTIAHASADADAPARAGFARWEGVAAALCLAQFSEPLFAAIAQSQGLAEPPGYARIFFLPVYAFLAFVLWRDRALAARTAWAAPLLMSLVVLAGASTLWSIDSGATLRRVVWLTLTMAFGLYLAWRYEWERLVTVIGGAFVVLIAGSLLLGLVAPSVGRMTFEHPGAWSGLWTHKNTLGGIMALGVAVCVSAALVEPKRRRFWFAWAAGAFALVLLSTSKTALVASMLGVAVIGACMLVRRGPLPALLVGAGVLGVVIVGTSIVLLAPDVIVAVLGRDLTLTGRTEIWDAAAPAVAAQPWFGYGYYAFWLPDNGPAFWVREAVAWQVASAHSSWLEMALGMGRVGVMLLALQLIATLWRGAGAIMDPRAGLWAPAFLAAFALYTMSESHAMQANNVFWTIYVAVAARLVLDARERKT